jgi:hypothetical protein
VRKKGDLPWQLTKERVQDKVEVKAWGVVAVPVRVQAAVVVAAKASVVVKVEKEEWVEEPWGLKASASVPNAALSHPIREVFLVSSRNVLSVEPRWSGHSRKVI